MQIRKITLIFRPLTFVSVNLMMAPCGATSGNSRVLLTYYKSLSHRICVARIEKMTGSFYCEIGNFRLFSTLYRMLLGVKR